MGRRLFFSARDGIHGRELWKSDGTKAGTVLVKDINPNEPNRASRPRDLTVVRGTLFFTASDGTHGRELWKSDGTAAGTVLVKDIAPKDSAYPSSNPASLTAMGGRLFFTAADGTHGEELWTSDGSRVGTVLVKDIAPRDSYYPSSYPSSLTAMGGRLFFAADDGTHGNELWRSDGSRAGTALVRDIDLVDDDPHYPGSRPSFLTAMGGRLFFAARDGTRGEELWRSDGSRVGTVLVKNINPGARYGFGRGSDPSYLTAVGGRLFFAADEGTRGEELWKSDGSRAGTVLVENINPRTDSGYDGNTPAGSHPSSLTAVGRRLFFTADDGTHGVELWKSDGSRAGTVLVKNIDPTSDGTYYSSLTAVGRRLFFTANDGTHGVELWKSDGSRAGTVLVKDIYPCLPAYGTSYGGSSPLLPTAVRGKLFFSANDGVHGRELWKSDGSRAGTVLVKDIKTGTTR